MQTYGAQQFFATLIILIDRWQVLSYLKIQVQVMIRMPLLSQALASNAGVFRGARAFHPSELPYGLLRGRLS